MTSHNFNLHRARGIWRRRVLLPVLRKFQPEQNVQLNGISMRVSLRDRIIGTLLWRDGAYEPQVLSIIKAMDLSGKVCVDVGANIGLHTLAMSQQAAQVFAFEPEPYNFSLLKRNIEANRRVNIRPFQSALGSLPGELRLRLDPFNYGDHRIGPTGITVSVNTADAVLKDLPDNSVALMKIDVQGYECEVIKGMAETLHRNPDVVIIAEIFPEGLEQAGHSATELVNTLKEQGFDGYEIHSYRIIPLLAANFYETFVGGNNVTVVLSRNQTLISSLVNCEKTK